MTAAAYEKLPAVIRTAYEKRDAALAKFFEDGVYQGKPIPPALVPKVCGYPQYPEWVKSTVNNWGLTFVPAPKDAKTEKFPAYRFGLLTEEKKTQFAIGTFDNPVKISFVQRSEKGGRLTYKVMMPENYRPYAKASDISMQHMLAAHLKHEAIKTYTPEELGYNEEKEEDGPLNLLSKRNIPIKYVGDKKKAWIAREKENPHPPYFALKHCDPIVREGRTIETEIRRFLGFNPKTGSILLGKKKYAPEECKDMMVVIIASYGDISIVNTNIYPTITAWKIYIVGQAANTGRFGDTNVEELDDDGVPMPLLDRDSDGNVVVVGENTAGQPADRKALPPPSAGDDDSANDEPPSPVGQRAKREREEDEKEEGSEKRAKPDEE